MPPLKRLGRPIWSWASTREALKVALVDESLSIPHDGGALLVGWSKLKILRPDTCPEMAHSLTWPFAALWQITFSQGVYPPQ